MVLTSEQWQEALQRAGGVVRFMTPITGCASR